MLPPQNSVGNCEIVDIARVRRTQVLHTVPISRNRSAEPWRLFNDSAVEDLGSQGREAGATGLQWSKWLAARGQSGMEAGRCPAGARAIRRARAAPASGRSCRLPSGLPRSWRQPLQGSPTSPSMATWLGCNGLPPDTSAVGAVGGANAGKVARLGANPAPSGDWQRRQARAHWVRHVEFHGSWTGCFNLFGERDERLFQLGRYCNKERMSVRPASGGQHGAGRAVSGAEASSWMPRDGHASQWEDCRVADLLPPFLDDLVGSPLSPHQGICTIPAI